MNLQIKSTEKMFPVRYSLEVTVDFAKFLQESIELIVIILIDIHDCKTAWCRPKLSWLAEKLV